MFITEDGIKYAVNPLNTDVKVKIHKMRKHDVVITDWKTGKEIFRQDGFEAPEHWSDTAINILCSRWARGKLGTSERECSTHDVFERIASSICNFGVETGHIDEGNVENWIDYLVAIQQDQRAVFNTPVYLNAGWTDNPRTSACFLIPVEDNYESLTTHTQVESRVFQHGGGAGVYVGNVSHEGRALSKGGYASGPLPFNEGWDRSSGAIKSGGSHRRAARDVTMDIRHPDCYRSKEYLDSLSVSALDLDFIREKQIFEQIRKDLASLGHDVGMNSIVDYMLPAQNANRAVLVYDEFLNAVKNDGEWDVCDPRSGERVWTYKAKEIWDALCYATWYAADPTIKYFDNINEYNMCRKGRLTLPDGTVLDFDNMEIVCSNPCISSSGCFQTRNETVTIEQLFDHGGVVDIWDGKEYRPARFFMSGKRRTVLVTLDDNTTIETTPDHIFYAYESNPHGPKEKLCPAKDLLGLYVFKDGKDLVRVESVEPQEGPVFVYDFEMLEGPHYALCNGIMVHNCNEVIYPVPPVSGALISCNLAMLRLTKYKQGRAGFDVDAYVADAQFMLTLQDVLVDYSDYPTELGTQWTRANRILGLSLSDLGGLLMSMGIPYDSDEGRLYAEAIAALHFYSATEQSIKMASKLGACENYARNADNVQDVLIKHGKHLELLMVKQWGKVFADESWVQMLQRTHDLANMSLLNLERYGLRNMQVVSYAPQGTTGMITDCFSTGPEPMIAPISYKTLSGGGTITQAPSVVRDALSLVLEAHVQDFCGEFLGTSPEAYARLKSDDAFAYLIENGTLAGFDDMDSGYDSIFATALGIHTKDGVKLSIHPNGHVDMVGVLQRFVSAAISKSVNVPNHITPEGISDIYMRAWEKGVKAISIYRDGSKGAQPVKIKLDEEVDQEVHDEQQDLLALTQEVERLKAELAKKNVPVKATRVKLPDNVPSLRKKIRLDGHEIYMHVGLYENGSAGEVFLTGVQGSFVAGMLDSFATLLSLGFQYGVPFEDLYRKFEAVSFAPQGWYSEIKGYASSLPSLILKLLKKGIDDGEFKRYADNFYGKNQSVGFPANFRPADHELDKRIAEIINQQKDLTDDEQSLVNDFVDQELNQQPVQQKTSDPCPVCGSLMVRTGKCKTCVSCSYSDGGCG